MTPNTLRTVQDDSHPTTRSGKRRRRQTQGAPAAGVVRTLDASAAKAPEAAAPQAQSRVRRLNPLRGLRHLPGIDLDDIDWDPLPDAEALGPHEQEED